MTLRRSQELFLNYSRNNRAKRESKPVHILLRRKNLGLLTALSPPCGHRASDAEGGLKNGRITHPFLRNLGTVRPPTSSSGISRGCLPVRRQGPLHSRHPRGHSGKARCCRLCGTEKGPQKPWTLYFVPGRRFPCERRWAAHVPGSIRGARSLI